MQIKCVITNKKTVAYSIAAHRRGERALNKSSSLLLLMQQWKIAPLSFQNPDQ